MKAQAKFLARQFVVMLLCVSVAFAQTPPSSDETSPLQPLFSQEELDQMLAPIALYPDSLLSQILMASTYPLEVVQAARWSKAHPNLTGDEAVKAVEEYDWDPSVKSLVAFPRVLAVLDEKLDWMERLGDAFLSQQQQVMDTIQDLRRRADTAGNLQSNEHVRVERQAQTIVVEPASPQVIYVPYYDPYVVYGTWWWPYYPPIYWAPWPGYYDRSGFGTGFWWGSGITLGVGFFFGAFDWPHRHIAIVNTHNYYYRPHYRSHPHIAQGPPDRWRHEPNHRHGVPYRDPGLRQKFGRADARPEVRREYRGDEERRWRDPRAPGIRPDARDIPRRAEPREHTRPEADGRTRRPTERDSARPELRSVPERPDFRVAPSHPEQREHTQPDAGGSSRRPIERDSGRPEPRVVPERPDFRAAPSRPRAPEGT
ncbi:MAG: DUF3300 domain-containing protein, partial [Burkholderiales bacterium]